MVRFQLNKLVRDNFVEIYEALGQKPTYRYLGPEDHITALKAKVAEEAGELIRASAADLASEIADVEQTLADLKRASGISNAEVDAIIASKKAKKGGFGKGLYIESLELADNDEWAAYYRKEPDRYPEM